MSKVETVRVIGEVVNGEKMRNSDKKWKTSGDTLIDWKGERWIMTSELKERLQAYGYTLCVKTFKNHDRIHFGNEQVNISLNLRGKLSEFTLDAIVEACIGVTSPCGNCATSDCEQCYPYCKQYCKTYAEYRETERKVADKWLKSKLAEIRRKFLYNKEVKPT